MNTENDKAGAGDFWKPTPRLKYSRIGREENGVACYTKVLLQMWISENGKEEWRELEEEV